MKNQITPRVVACILWVGVWTVVTQCFAQQPVFSPAVDIDQSALLSNCLTATDNSCQYKLKEVLISGGDFWTSPFQPYDAVTKTGDGYGEGINGPRRYQRSAFASFMTGAPKYRYLRMNGLDSQSCFECHNSIGSDPVSYDVQDRGALMRKSPTVGGAAGLNSNAFINPYFPKPFTLLVRNPPAVFGSGYVQAVADEMTLELFVERERARLLARRAPGRQVKQALSAKGVSFGYILTTYTPGSPPRILADTTICNPTAGVASIGGVQGYTEDMMHVEGVSCDLVVRPFQWKGITSSLRHFVQGALDFHFSMQPFETVGLCDCDADGKGKSLTGPDGPEVTIGNLTALASFVGMMRPPVQTPPSTAAEKRGEQLFLGKVPGTYGQMCASCHVASLHLIVPTMLVEWPVNGKGGYIDVGNPDSWAIPPSLCKEGIPPPPPNMCPIESLTPYLRRKQVDTENGAALVTPFASAQQQQIVRRYIEKMAELRERKQFSLQSLNGTAGMTTVIRELRAPMTGETTSKGAGKSLGLVPNASSVVGRDYVIPLSADSSDLTPIQLPRLPQQQDGSISVPLFSDLKRHKMAGDLTDPSPNGFAQSTDVQGIKTRPAEFLTRPLWGVADTGPWLHDGRAMTLKEAILLHGDSSTGSESGPVIDAFEKLSSSDQDAVVSFLLTLRLPTAPPQ